MDNKKISLIIVIILLGLFTPGAVIGTIRHVKNNKNTPTVKDDNPNHDFYYQGKLYFYVDNELVSTYECSNCSIATPTIDDSNYHTRYYKDGTTILKPILNNMFAIFSEKDSISLYNLVTKNVVTTYETIKTYSSEEVNQLILIKKAGLWGVLNINDISKNVDTKYDFLAAPAHFIGDKLDMSQLIAKNGEDWLIITSDGTTIHKSINGEIVDFNANYYITYNNGIYNAYDFKDTEYLESIEKKDITLLDNKIFVLLEDKLAVFSSLNEGALKVISVPSDITSIYYKNDADKYEVYINDNLFQTIELGNNI